MSEWYSECCVIGGGVIGLAVARQLALEGFEVTLLEQESSIGSHTSSRNSEVIHAGLYYPPNSLKAYHCRRGRDALYEFCDTYAIPYSRCGKLIVASNERQQAQLQHIHARAICNGVLDLEELDRHAIEQLEPALQGETALLSPATGIIDTHAYMLALQGDIERHGGLLVTNNQVVNVQQARAGGYELNILDTRNNQLTGLTCRYLINASGLFSADWLRQLDAFPNTAIPAMRYAKGNYFQLDCQSPFSHLIYPVPEPGGLGIHLTLDLAGRARFGPDVQWLGVQWRETDCLSQPDYRVDAARASDFYSAIRNYWPDLRDGQLSAAYAGIRPKIAGSTSDNDFMIQTQKAHGLPGWINLLGIESPGLTASLSLAEHVCTIIRDPS